MEEVWKRVEEEIRWVEDCSVEMKKSEAVRIEVIDVWMNEMNACIMDG